MRPRRLRLTRQAEARLNDIAAWTIETFGSRQAAVYEVELIARCAEIADGSLPGKNCRALIDPNLTEDMRYARAGQHYIVFIASDEDVIVLDFLHVRSNLPERLAALRVS